MNLLFRVIFASGCTSTHHKIALDALCHLRGRRVSRWQNLFLKHHKVFLAGSKAPDKEFKDFRNHVLHVRDNYWGGAVKTTRQWYDRTVGALERRDWRDAVYSAGVLSHYYSDPIQPFHTGQSQAESNIHRAAEWSIAKAYSDIRQIIESQTGFPQLETPSDDDWLEQMVIAGAEAANPHYETLIEHYDMKAGVKDPPAGLDAKSREILATLIGHAVVGFARILERAIDESGAAPPRTEVSLQGFLATLQIPIYWVTKKMADAGERRIVTAMYKELQETGKVEQNLPEDDLAIRQLHEQEVLSRAPAPSESKTPSRPKSVRRIDKTPSVANPLPSSTSQPHLRFHLQTSSDVEEAPSIGPKTARRLEKIGVKTVSDLLALDPQQAAPQIGLRYITEQVLVAWQDQAKLVCQIPEIRGHDAAIMVACGWRDPASIAGENPEEMLNVVVPFVETSEGKRIIRSGKKPDLAEVRDWIEWAGHARSLNAA